MMTIFVNSIHFPLVQIYPNFCNSIPREELETHLNRLKCFLTIVKELYGPYVEPFKDSVLSLVTLDQDKGFFSSCFYYSTERCSRIILSERRSPVLFF